MPYMDQYRARVLAYGTTEQERIENKLERDFNALVLKSPDKCVFTYKNTTYSGILSSGARSAAQSESKIIFYLWGPKSLPLPEGAVITTEDRGYNKTRYWIVMNQEVHPYYGYFKYKMLELDYMLKFVGTDGQEHTLPCYINGTGTFDIKEYFKYSSGNMIERPNRALNLVFAARDDLDEKCTFIIGKETWRYVDSDLISIPGVAYATIYATGIDESQDSVDDQLAGQARLDTIDIITNYGTGADGEEISINDEFTNLEFYLMRNGKLGKASFSYDISSGFANQNEDGSFELLGDDGTITVTDNITNFSKTFSFIIDQVSDYLYVIGNTDIDAFSENYYIVNTDYDDYTLEYNSDMIAAKKLKDGRVKITARSTLGDTDIVFKDAAGTEITTLTLSIGHVWR